jgi:hypothetical protein
MWIVRLALRRPYTFAVLALLIAILGALTLVRTADRSWDARIAGEPPALPGTPRLRLGRRITRMRTRALSDADIWAPGRYLGKGRPHRPQASQTATRSRPTRLWHRNCGEYRRQRAKPSHDETYP